MRIRTLLLGTGTLLVSALPCYASINISRDCLGGDFAFNHWRLSSTDGPLPLKKVADLLKESDQFDAIEVFDQVTSSADLTSIPIDGMVISTKSSNMAEIQVTLDRIESVAGIDVGCVSKGSFDLQGNF